MMEPVQIHELLGQGIRAARLRNGWRQQDASARFRRSGLPTWRPVAVGQVEAGTRKPSIGELLLVCAVLEVSLADLVPDTGEPVDLGVGATMSAAAVRALLSGDVGQFIAISAGEFNYPGEAEATERAWAERDRQRALIGPLLNGTGIDPYSGEFHTVFLEPTEAEGRAAVKLGVEPVVLRTAAFILWGRDFEAERDDRAANGGDARAIAARRGHATRAMLAELQELIDRAYGTGAGGDDA
jgi:transcriptional regulator with XRE-family HTH domain